MALVFVFFVSTYCLLHSSALVTHKPVDDFTTDRHRRVSAQTRNSAGCFPLGSHLKDGVCPVEDLKRILDEGFKLGLSGTQECNEINKNTTFCPKPRTDPLLGEKDQEWYAELVDHVKKELAQSDKSLPIVAAAWDQPIGADARSAQMMNVMCGFERLGMSKRALLFATDERIYDNLTVEIPNAIIVYHPHIRKFLQAMADRTNVKYLNRLIKLVVAQIVLDAGRDVIITDTDIVWIRDSSEVFLKSGLDFAAMRDSCPHDINSGFVYYRNVPRTRDLLHMTLSTWRESNFCGDNDQYVLNCGWKRAAVKGLNYRILPVNGWSLRCQAGMQCGCTESLQVLGDSYGQQMFGLGDGYPYIYHTLRMSTPYIDELDMIAALGMADVDFKTGQCKKGPRVITTDTLTKQCSTREDGITHAMCEGSCKKEPTHTDAIVADLRSRLR